MHQLPYLAAHQLIHRLYADEFDNEFENDWEVVDDTPKGQPRLDTLRVALAELLRRTADRVEPLGVTS